MYLKNCWYAAAWDNEVGQTPLARTLLDRPVVLFRTSAGIPVALEDRCCHRGLPLSMGRVLGDSLQCGYHGLRFEADGRCIEVPGQSQIPPGARVTAYPLVERHKWVWIWMGDPDLADAALIPDWWRMDHPDWTPIKGGAPFHVLANYLLVNDNLLDLSHVAFVHDGSIGTGSVTDFPITTERGDAFVKMTRVVEDSPPPPLYQALGRFTANVDRWQVAESTLPAYNTVHAGCALPGAGTSNAPPDQKMEFFNLNAMTPETATSTHYFYAHTRSFRLDDTGVDETFRKDFRTVFAQDIGILDAQQANMARRPDGHSIDINVDGPAMLFRRMLDQRIAAEA
jgi:phenylpropionate dioxygenase-like ring-hydroxylating dioxygenase large terminal subunit